MIIEQNKKSKGGRPRKQVESELPGDILLQVKRALYKASFHEFFKAAFPQIRGERYEEMPHVKFLCDELQAVGCG